MKLNERNPGKCMTLTLVLSLVGCGSSDSTAAKPAANPPSQPSPVVAAQMAPVVAALPQPASTPQQSASSPAPSSTASPPSSTQVSSPPTPPANSPEADDRRKDQQSVAVQSSPPASSTPSSAPDGMNSSDPTKKPAAGSKMPNPTPTAGMTGLPADAKKMINAGTGVPPGGPYAHSGQDKAQAAGGAGGSGSAGSGSGNPRRRGGGQGDGSGREGGQKFAPGSLEDVIFNFCTALADDDTATASDYISTKSATGVLIKVRDGDLAEEKIEELSDLFNPITDLRLIEDQPGGNKRVFRNGKGQTITIGLRKEKETFRVIELTFKSRKTPNAQSQ